MAIGNNSNFPLYYDDLFQVYEESYTGHSISGERKVIPDSPYEITLNHLAKTGTLSIAGYTETASSTPAGREYYVTDYAVPTGGSTGIDYECGQTLRFNSNDVGNIISISYVTPGDKITANLLNKIIDSNYKIQRAIGLLGSRRELELGDYNSLAGCVSWIKNLLLSHNHTGGDARYSTQQLTSNSFSDALEITNSNVADTAAIDQSKLANGMLDFGESSIAMGETSKTITSDVWADTNKYALVWRKYTAGDPDGAIAVSPGTSDFTVYWLGATPLAQAVAFYWLIF